VLISPFPKIPQHPKAPNYYSLRQDMLSFSAILFYGSSTALLVSHKQILLKAADKRMTLALTTKDRLLPVGL